MTAGRFFAVVCCFFGLVSCYRCAWHPWVVMLNWNSTVMRELQALREAQGDNAEDVLTRRTELALGLQVMAEAFPSFMRWVALAIAWSVAGGALVARYWIG